MKLQALFIFLVVLLGLVPVYFINRYLKRVIQPRQGPARLFLFFFANFLLIIVYTVLLVGLIARIFPVRK